MAPTSTTARTRTRALFAAATPGRGVRRLALLAGTVVASVHGGGHAGTTPVITTMSPPGQRKSHLPFLTGIEYETPPADATHLPPPDIHGHHHPSVEQVISNRRSCRAFAPPPTGLVHLYEVAQLCWAAQGITTAEEPPDEFGHAGAARRAAPSGGRLYPLTVYAITSPGVGGIEAGVYRYLPHSHSLQPVPRGLGGFINDDDDAAADDETAGGGSDDACSDEATEETDVTRGALQQLCDATVPQVASMFHQEWIDGAALIFLVSGNVDTTAKHGGLYARFAVDLVKYEAGMVAENLALQATALGLAATPVGAFEAGAVKGVIATPEVGEEPLMMMAVGVPQGSYREHHGGVRLDEEDDGYLTGAEELHL